MKTILVAGSKGGVGKTTIATHLAAYSALQGKRTVLADAGVALATIVQLISCRVINSIAGFEALEAARFDRLTLSGSSFESREGLAPAIASRAAPLLNAAANESYSHFGAVSKLSSEA